MERWGEAVRVLEDLYTWQTDEATFWKVEWAKFELRRVQRPDYYCILGVPKEATQAEIRAAFRRRSAEQHPDKQLQRNASVDLEEAKAQFQLLAEAFEILGTDVKRDFYDRGYDAPGIRECIQVRKRAVGQRPCACCGEDEAGALSSDGRWLCHGCLGRPAAGAAPSGGLGCQAAAAAPASRPAAARPAPATPAGRGAGIASRGPSPWPKECQPLPCPSAPVLQLLARPLTFEVVD